MLEVGRAREWALESERRRLLEVESGELEEETEVCLMLRRVGMERR